MADVPDPWPPWAQTWVLPYLRERALWPVATAILGHVVVVLVPLMLWAARSGNPLPILALLVLASASVHMIVVEWRAERRFGVVSFAIASVWSVSAPLAWFTGRTGVF